MNLDKSKKRIAKKVKAGFKGYPLINIIYQGDSADIAQQVVVEFVFEEGAEAQQEVFKSTADARQDEVIQTALIKIIDRADAKTVTESESVVVV
ncbi:hypothetical protein [Shewanella sp. KT0246]|uniref:hypothetical protein n=1 Tax=Shewanella sp. KT0246 TaxID=2815912 RepID=UPI001BC496BC|nr:hypothetical protein [Shewanella sp. KT0246]GIU48200.1 hypothetical protein TUM4249_02870 [Shewanella sp. KT0246]